MYAIVTDDLYAVWVGFPCGDTDAYYPEQVELATELDRKWSELTEVFRDYLRVISRDLHKSRDGDLVLRRSYAGWIEKDFGWEVVHGGYVNEFTVTGETAEEAMDRAITEFRRLSEGAR
ncbi:hypothetical protein [Brevibacillus agri]|uniref:hypothetical protein n=1 Tax=Brevibacillus agri TaxID=51101 RepID=UPI0012DE8C8B|nr:hypothetical protein [Brevibacillus agri]